MTSSWVDPKWGFTGYKWVLSCVQILSDWECWRRCLFHGKIQDTSPPLLVFMYALESHPCAKFISFWSDFKWVFAMLKPQIKSVINMKTTSMSGSKEQTSQKGAHQNALNRFGTDDFLECSRFNITSTVTSSNAGFWPVWNIYQLNL